MPHVVQQHRDDERVGRVAVRAAQDAADPGLGRVEGLHRRVRLVDAGPEERVEVQPGDGDDPEEIEGDLAEPVERIQAVAEGPVEERLDAEKDAAARCPDEFHSIASVHARAAAANTMVACTARNRGSDPAAVRARAFTTMHPALLNGSSRWSA